MVFMDIEITFREFYQARDNVLCNKTFDIQAYFHRASEAQCESKQCCSYAMARFGFIQYNDDDVHFVLDRKA